MPGLRSFSALVLGSALVLAQANADEYVVKLGPAANGVQTLISSFGQAGLHPLRELRNLPGTVVVEMPATTAQVLIAKGYKVERSPVRRLLSVPWSLDRENQRTLPLDGNDSHPYSGNGVEIFIVDTDILRNTDEFGNRLVGGTSYVSDGKGAFGACGDQATHATGVASVAAGNRYGVAPGASIFIMRIYDCQGVTSGAAIFGALDDIVTWRKANPTAAAVVNMSFGGPGRSQTEDELLAMLASLGLPLVAAAANDDADACGYGPAGSPSVIAVAASTEDDEKASFSNWGSCVALFAPGMNVPEELGPDDSQGWSGSGTSASAPAVSGEIALLYEQVPDLTLSEIRSVLLANADQDVLQGDLGVGSPNLLLYTDGVTEEVDRVIARWFPSQKRFTVQVTVSLNGNPTPFDHAFLFRGLPKDGHCQGSPFATVHLSGGFGIASVVGWNRAPATVCLETRAGTLYVRSVRTFPDGDRSRPSREREPS